jgi:glycosyltransferase involved in cell wall biosynthesis
LAGEEALVTVVTPFYNTEAYLAECIESVLAQSFTRFDYVLIDNHSRDGSAAIAARYAARDARIRVVQPPSFLSQVENYNFALTQLAAQARYAKMVQADDWLFPRCLEEMVGLAEANPGVVLVSSYRMVEAEVAGKGIHPHTRVMSGRDACRMQLLHRGYPFGSPTTLLYRADVVRQRSPSFYAEGHLHEDTEAAFEILAGHDFGFVHQVLSFTRRENESLMKSAHAFQPHTLDHYIIARRYGALYLEPDERVVCEREARTLLYAGMADRWLLDRVAGRDERFWEYQEKGLASIGEHIERRELMRFIVKRAARLSLSPLEALRSIAQARSARS